MPAPAPVGAALAARYRPRMRLALLTDARYVGPAAPGDDYHGNILLEDRLLAEALAPYGVATRRVDWADPGVAWGDFDAAVFRTTWDYFDRFLAFRAWLDRVEPLVPLLNPAPQVRWNVDKRYLLALQGAGIPIVPTRLVAGAASLDAVLAAEGWEEAVIKPAVSGAARETYRVRRGDRAMAARFAALVAREDMLVQPFVADVTTGGEVSVIVLGGQVSHAVRKVPKPGDFRVQDDHGGTVHPHVATLEEAAFAERAVAACTPAPVYARVDLVRHAGGLAIMELELVEPELFLRTAPKAAERLAAAIVGAVGRAGSTPATGRAPTSRWRR